MVGEKIVINDGGTTSYGRVSKHVSQSVVSQW